VKKRYVFGGALVLAISVAYMSLPRASRTKKPETVAALSNEVGFTFPPSARLVGVHRESGMDDLVQFKLQLKAEELPALLNAAQVDLSMMSADNVAYFGLDKGFWDPNHARGFRGVQVRREKSFRTLNIGVSEAQDGFADVYVMEHGD
jgi:hypothetical protein